MPANTLPEEIKAIAKENADLIGHAAGCGLPIEPLIESALLAAIPVWNKRVENRLNELIEQWEEYYTAFTSPYYRVLGTGPDAMKGLRQCIDELKVAKADLEGK